MSSASSHGDAVQHPDGLSRHSSGQAHAPAAATSDSNGVGAPISPSAASNPYIESQCERPLPSASHRPSPGTSGSSHSLSFPRSAHTSTAMSRNASLSNLDIQAAPNEGILLSIKCPSLVRDSALVRFTSETSVLQIKQSIERTWPGKPKAQGLRFIRGGRLLDDDEKVCDFARGTDPNEPVSVHLVIRPDAWLDPKNRPTPSRRSSYLRQVPLASPLATPGIPEHLEAEFSSYFTTQPSPLDSSVPQGASPLSNVARLARDAGSPFSPTSLSLGRNHSRSRSRSRQRDTEASVTPTGQDPGPSTLPTPTTSAMNVLEHESRPPSPILLLPQSFGLDEELSRIFIATAAPDWPLLIESAVALYDAYFSAYTRLYKASCQAQLGEAGQTGTAESGDSAALDENEVADEDDDGSEPDPLISSIEQDLFGWDPIETSHAEPGLAGDENVQYKYREVQFNGLPYLLQVPVTSSDQLRGTAMAALLARMPRLIQLIHTVSHFNTVLTTRANTPTLTAPRAAARAVNVGAPLAARPGTDPVAGLRAQLQAQGQAVPGGIANLVPVHVRNMLNDMSELTWNEVGTMLVPLFFLGLKLGIMFYVFSRGASPTKKRVMLATAVLYVFYEAYKMVRRRTDARRAVRERQAALAAVAAAGPVRANAGRNGPPEPVGGAAGRAGDGGARPAGANVPHAALSEAERLAASDPLTPLPPIRAPRRYTAAPSLYNLEYWLELLAYFGMDSEDEELGLLPPQHAGTAIQSSRSVTRRRGRIFHFVLVPVVLFFATMVPVIEIKRRRAIEEREETVRIAVRLQQERDERIASQQRDGEGSDDGAAGEVGAEPRVPGLRDGGYEVRNEYSGRILSRRRGVEGGIVNQQDADAIRAAVRDDEGNEDLQLF